MNPTLNASLRRIAPACAAAAVLAGCALPVPVAVSVRNEIVVATTGRNELVSFRAGQPDVVLTRVAIVGLQPGERISGIDFRPANGKLYALGTSLRLYILDTVTGSAAPVGTGPLAIRLAGTELGFDFNPVVDRIRVVTDKGENLRVHPDTGAVVDADPNRPGIQLDVGLRYDEEDENGGRLPRVTGAAYTNGGVPNARITTNFAIDGILGVLVTLGTRESITPAYAPATPNTGLLFTVGSLGVQPDGPVSFDIAGGSASGPRDGTAFAAFIPLGRNTATLYQIHLSTGKATALGTIGRGEPVTGIAIQP